MPDIFEYLRYTANLIAGSRFGNQIILKGGSVLLSKLIECGREDLFRLTRDLDIHCDKKEVWMDFYTNIESVLNINDRGYIYKITKRRSQEKGLDTSDSLTFLLNDNEKAIQFKMDMNIKSNNIITVDYSPILNLTTYDTYTMLADKITAVSSRKIFRRIKDLYDITVLAAIQSYSYLNIMEHLNTKHPDAALTNMLTPENFSDLEHAYQMYKGITNKPYIGDLIGYSSAFLEPFYIRYNQGDLIWNTQESKWVRS